MRYGPVPKHLENARSSGVFFEADIGHFLLHVDYAARYLVSGGNEITVEPLPGADQRIILLLLFGSVFGALLYQRRVLVLHASAIVTDRGAVAFAGGSGFGKSTLAAAFRRRGHQILADEVCPVSTNHFPAVLPALNSLMLWADSIDQLGLDQENLQQARPGIEKYMLPLGESLASRSVPLYAVYLLEPTNSGEFSLVPIRGLAKIRMLNTASYKPHFVEGMNLGAQHSRHVAEVARNAKVAVVKRPRDGFRVDELAELISSDLAA